jgi:glycosyltransferase involved in cell wall biosynthesis
MFSQGLESGRGDLVRARGLIEALRRDGHDVLVVEALNRPGRGVEESFYRGVVRRLLPGRGHLVLRDVAWWRRSRAHGRRVADAAHFQRAEVLVETQVHGTVSGSVAARRTGLPLVLDDVSPVGEVVHLGAGLPGLARRAFRKQCAAAALLVAPTGIISAQVARASSASQVTVISNGVDLEAYRRAKRDAVRRALRVGEEILVGFAGSFQPWHEIPLLLRAFEAIKPRRPVRLLLVGDGPSREGALREIRERGLEARVIAPGAVSPGRLPELLAACDIGVLPGTN